MKKYTLFYSAVSFLLGGAFIYFLAHLQHGKDEVKSPSAVLVDRNGLPIADRVQLNIDAGLQKIVEGELDKAFATLHPKKIIAVLADPKSGEILAMANRPVLAGAGPSTHKLMPFPFATAPVALSKFWPLQTS